MRRINGNTTQTACHPWARTTLTQDAVAELRLKQGAAACAVIKASHVVLGVWEGVSVVTHAHALHLKFRVI